MDTTNIRYQFEHQILPAMFYATKENFFYSIKKKPDLAFDVLDNIYSSVRQKIPYDRENFKCNFLDDTQHIIAILKLPEPERTPLCERIYFVADKNFERFAYFTIERSLFGASFLCGWDSSVTCHNNYGICRSTNEVKRILEVFEGKYA